MSTANKACDAAAAAGVLGALGCMVTLNVGDGQHRVTAIVRAAVVFLTLAVGSSLLRSRVSSAGGKLLLFIGASVAAGALGMAFGFFKSSYGTLDLNPFEAIGAPMILPAATLVAALVIAAMAAEKAGGREASDRLG